MKKLIDIIGWSLFWIMSPIAVVYAFIVKFLVKVEKSLDDEYLTCSHGVTGNSMHMFFKSCSGCRGNLQENGYRMDEFIEEYTKECRTRYLTTYRDVVKRVTG